MRLQDGRVLVAGGRSFWALGEEGNGPIPGFTDDFSVLSTRTEFFDPQSGRWREGPPLPAGAGRGRHPRRIARGPANGVCLAALPDDSVVIAGGGTQTDGAAFPHTLLTRSSILVMTPGRDPLNSTYQISPNAIPSVDNGRLFGDAGRNQLAVLRHVDGKVLIAGGQNSAEDVCTTPTCSTHGHSA